MGQKSNLLTVRTGFRGVPQGNTLQKDISTRLIFIKLVELLFRGRRVFVPHANFFVQGGSGFINLTLFFRAAKLLELKKHVRAHVSSLKKRGPSKKTVTSLSKMYGLFFFNNFFTRLVFFKSLFSGVVRTQVLNRFLVKSFMARAYSKCLRLVKKASGVLFLRRYLLLVDVAKLLTLLLYKKISFHFFLRLLGDIFRGLQKKRHSRFLFFLKELFTFLIAYKTKSGVPVYKGVKFRVNGRLNGKPRSGTSCLILGSVPASTLSSKTLFAVTHVYTVYGAFGFRIWATLH